MSDTVWVVSDCVDLVAERPRKAVERQARWREKWKWNPLLVFEEKDPAYRYVVQRAEAAVAVEKKLLKQAERRLKKCESKFGSPQEQLK